MGCLSSKSSHRFNRGNVSDIKLILDQMLNATSSGSGGLVMNTIPVLDLALWDLFGKWLACRSQTVGGGARRISSTPPARPDLAQEMVHRRQKCLPWGRRRGDAGIR